MTSLRNHIPMKNVSAALGQEVGGQWRNELESKAAGEG